MADLENLSFEDPDRSAPGNADGWTFAQLSSVYEFAGYVASQNRFTYSEQFDDADWSKTQCTITADATDPPAETGAPDGTADKLVEASDSAQWHQVSQAFTDLGSRTTVQVYAKAAGRDWLSIKLNNPWGSVYFDLANGELGSVPSAWASKNVRTAIADAGDGWYLCTLSIDTGASHTVILLPATADGTQQYDGDGSSGIYLFGAQLTNGQGPGEYVLTEAAEVANTRGVEDFESWWENDPTLDEIPATELDVALYDTTATVETFEADAGWDSAYLTELTTTSAAAYVTGANDVPYSQQFDNVAWTKTNCTVVGEQVAAPDSTVTADKVTENATTGQHAVTEYFGSHGGSGIVWSIYAKPINQSWIYIGNSGYGYMWFDIANGVVGSTTIDGGYSPTGNMIAMGDGWVRCELWWDDDGDEYSVTFGTSTGDGVSSHAGIDNDAVYFWGAASRDGDLAGPYVETTDAALETTADVEDFEQLWAAGNWLLRAELESPIAGAFDAGAEAQDTFEDDEGWDDDYEQTIGSSSLASYDSGGTPENVEDFEEVQAPVPFTVTLDSDKLNATGHPFSNDDPITLQSTGRLPWGLSTLATYYVIEDQANDFEASLTVGGNGVDIVDYGYGIHEALADKSAFWVTQLE